VDWRARREAAGLTRREVASMAGVSLRTLERIERGERRATPGLARWLTRLYSGSRRASANA
jgi:transcriptional regulator with XRE-family HTH domain